MLLEILQPSVIKISCDFSTQEEWWGKASSAEFCKFSFNGMLDFLWGHRMDFSCLNSRMKHTFLLIREWNVLFSPCWNSITTGDTFNKINAVMMNCEQRSVLWGTFIWHMKELWAYIWKVDHCFWYPWPIQVCVQGRGHKNTGPTRKLIGPQNASSPVIRQFKTYNWLHISWQC